MLHIHVRFIARCNLSSQVKSNLDTVVIFDLHFKKVVAKCKCVRIG